MSRIFITGSTDGLGLAAARALLDDGHDVIVHARSIQRQDAIQPLLEKGAQVVTGDLSVMADLVSIAEQVNRCGRIDTVIHNAGVGVDAGKRILPVNVVAPYVLTALMTKPSRLIYLSSSMHLAGRTTLDGMDWSGQRVTGSYSDSKLFVTALSAAVARRWPDVISHSVDPGWVPTRMGGPDAPDSLVQGHHTQVWLATTNDPDACESWGYWHHLRRQPPHPAVTDALFQDALLSHLEAATGISLPSS